MTNRETQLAELVVAVQTSTRYRTIDRQLVERVGREALSRYPSLKTAIKAARSQLYQMIGAYAERTPPYEQVACRATTGTGCCFTQGHLSTPAGFACIHP